MNRILTLRGGWLHFPASEGVRPCYIRVCCEGRMITEKRIGITTGPADYYVGMALTAYEGKRIELSTCDTELRGHFDGVVSGDDMARETALYPDLYRERLRPVWHYSARRGWLNDPNGLFFDGSLYHLYYQHNPYSVRTGCENMQWGHAVSCDLLSWAEQPDAVIMPDCKMEVASGSAIIDRRGVAGYGKGAVIAAYTAHGSLDYRQDPPTLLTYDGQYFSYSTDGGFSFTPFPDNPIIPCAEGTTWRDPMLREMEDGSFLACVYETHEGQDCAAFYRSDDLHHWTRTSRTTDLHECPDFFPLEVEGTGERLWVLYGGNGSYRVGQLTDGIFTCMQEAKSIELGSGYLYAGQTWDGDKSTRYHIAWIRGIESHRQWNGDTGYAGAPFSQCMSAICALRLQRNAEGYAMQRTPIRAYESLRQPDATRIDSHGTGEIRLVPETPGDLIITLRADAPVSIRYGVLSMRYDPASGQITLSNGKSVSLYGKNVLELRLMTDKTSAEFFMNGRVSATLGIYPEGIPLIFSGESDIDITGNAWKMQSIWP